MENIDENAMVIDKSSLSKKNTISKTPLRESTNDSVTPLKLEKQLLTNIEEIQQKEEEEGETQTIDSGENHHYTIDKGDELSDSSFKSGLNTVLDVDTEYETACEALSPRSDVEEEDSWTTETTMVLAGLRSPDEEGSKNEMNDDTLNNLIGALAGISLNDDSKENSLSREFENDKDAPKTIESDLRTSLNLRDVEPINAVVAADDSFQYNEEESKYFDSSEHNKSENPQNETGRSILIQANSVVTAMTEEDSNETYTNCSANEETLTTFGISLEEPFKTESSMEFVNEKNCIEEKVNENIENCINEKVSENIENNINENVSENIENCIEEKVSENVENHINEKVSENIENCIKEKVSENIENYINEKVSENIENYINEKVSENIENCIEEKVSENIENYINEKVSENIENCIEEKVSENIENCIEEKVSENIENCIEEKVSKYIENRIEEKVSGKDKYCFPEEKVTEDMSRITSNDDLYLYPSLTLIPPPPEMALDYGSESNEEDISEKNKIEKEGTNEAWESTRQQYSVPFECMMHPAESPSKVNQSEAGPVTADDTFVSAREAFLNQDPSEFDLDFLENFGGKGKRKNSLSRKSLFVNFDPFCVTQSPFETKMSSRITEEASKKQECENVAENLIAKETKVVESSCHSSSQSSQKFLDITPPKTAAEESQLSITPTYRLARTSTGSTVTPNTVRQDILSREISKLQDLMIQQEQSYQEQLLMREDEIEVLRKKIEEIQTKQPILEMEEKLKTSDATVSQLKKEVAEHVLSNKQLKVIMNEYEKTISQLITKREDEKKEFEQGKEAIAKERDITIQHLTNLEAAFNDLHQKYEKAKSVIEAMKVNEKALKDCLEKNGDTIKKLNEDLQKLKAHATERLEAANTELGTIKEKHQHEIIKYQAIAKRAEVEKKSLEDSLEMKKKQVTELTQICDELIVKLGIK